MITCHGVTEGKRNKHSIYEFSLHFSASALSNAELSVLINQLAAFHFGHISFTLTILAGLHITTLSFVCDF